jgi:Rieske Fe-S protein
MPFDAGPVTDFPAMTWRLLPAPNNVIVGRDAMGLFAFTAVCTHEACIIRFNPTGPTSTTGTTRCPCHMSTFNGNGEVQPGSRATRNLPHFQVTVASGRVTVNPTMTVDAAIRTAV